MKNARTIMVVRQPVTSITQWKKIQATGFEIKDFLEAIGCYYVNFSIGKYKVPGFDNDPFPYHDFPVLYFGFMPSNYNDNDNIRELVNQVFTDCSVLTIYKKENNYDSES